MPSLLELGRKLRHSRPVRSLRRWIPRPIKDTIRRVVLYAGLRWVSWDFRRDRIPSRSALGLARFGWGNSGWPADGEFLRASCELLRRSSSDALECGSGLSTVVFALGLRGKRTRLLTLEHQEEWFDKVRKQLARFDSTAVQLVHTPLMNYGEFDWYSMPAEIDDRRFGIVICDGPPSTTLGGRYGLLPVARDHLQAPATILLDDSAREGEKRVLRRWADQFDAVWEDHEESGFAVVTANPRELSV